MTNYLSKEGLEKLKKELKYLETEGRKEISERLKKAISYGDLSENAAYEEAKEAQSFLEGRIRELKNILNSAEIVEKKTRDKVGIGSKVTVKNAEEEQYTITGSAAESDPLRGLISSDSPLGKSLMGKKKGDKIEIDAPGGKTEYKILKIE